MPRYNEEDGKLVDTQKVTSKNYVDVEDVFATASCWSTHVGNDNVKNQD